MTLVGPSRAAYRPGYEVVAEQILQLIGEIGMAPGDRMPTEMELAARLGASRTMVREAVKILSAMGRVSAQKGRGLYVADGDGVLGATTFGGFFMPTNLDHIFMLFEFRRVQEIAASRLAATQASPAELRVIEAAVQTCRRGHQTGDKEQFEAGDDAFHLGVAAASHNFFLVAAVREARRLQRQASVIGIRGSGRARRRGGRGTRRDLPRDPRWPTRCGRRRHRGASGQHPQGLPSRDPAPRLRRGIRRQPRR